MRKRTVPIKTALVAALALVALLVSTGCARNWPDEFPDPVSWQRRSAPLDLLAGTDGGVSYAVSAYATSRPNPPVSEQTEYRDDQRAPTRLDVVCIDHDGDGYGRLAINLSLSKPVLESWHPRGWDRWWLEFKTPDGQAEIQIPLENDDGEGLESGFVPYVHGPERVDEVMDQFRSYAGSDAAVLSVRADFPAEEAKPPLEWDFDLGPSSRAENVLKNLVEVCGGVW